jgi:hypothetical protein
LGCCRNWHTASFHDSYHEYYQSDECDIEHVNDQFGEHYVQHSDGGWLDYNYDYPVACDHEHSLYDYHDDRFRG